MFFPFELLQALDTIACVGHVYMLFRFRDGRKHIGSSQINAGEPGH